MTEVSFYHLQRSRLDEALPRLLEKALGAGFRVLLKTPSAAEAERLNTVLWTYGQGSFLPHGTAADGHAAEQPVYLTETDDNPNAADLVCQVGGAEAGRLAGFRRALDLFDGSDPDMVAAARQRWKRYLDAGHALSYWQQTGSGGWERKAQSAKPQA